MKEYTDVALNTAESAGVTFADIRFQERRSNQVVVARRSLRTINDSENAGFSVRVLLNGSAVPTQITRS